MSKLVILSSHPIQYNAPFFQLLAQRQLISIKVFYTQPHKFKGFDKEFGERINWNIPLLEGYDYEFISENQKKSDFLKRINHYKPDALLVYGWNIKFHFCAMRYFKGKIPVWFRGDSTLLDEQPGPKTLLRRLSLKLVYHFIDQALYVGTNNKQYFLRHGLSEKKLYFAPHAVENKRFSTVSDVEKQYIQHWQTQLNIVASDVVFLFVGKFIEKKNPELLLRTFTALTNPRVKLIMVGEGHLKAHLQTQFAHDSRIFFLGFQNQKEMPKVYRLADVLVMPSAYNETWGLSLNEAMASGLCAIASNKVGAALDLVIPSKTGYIFQEGNMKDLRQKMELCISDKAKLEKMKQQAKHHVLNNWNYELSVKAIEAQLKLL